MNQSGASSKEVGDIDIFKEETFHYAIEVKDKDFNSYDLEHAFSKIISSQMETKCNFVMPVFSQDLLKSYGCPAKYSTFSSDQFLLTCPQEEVARIWEDNVNLLVEDQKEKYGCLNQDCCQQVETLITGSFSVVTVTNLVIATFLFTLIIN